MIEFMKTHMLKKMISFVTAISLSLSLLLTVTVSAAEKPTVSLSGTKVTISGSAGDMKNVTCIVLKPGYADVNGVTADQIDKAYQFVQEKDLTADTYDFSFLMLDSDESGTYAAFIGGDGTISEGAEFYYASKNDRLAAIDNIVKATSADALTGILLGGKDEDPAYFKRIYGAMGFLIDSYTSMGTAQQKEINQALYAARGDFTGDDASDKAALVFNDALALSCVNHADDAEKMMQAIVDYNTVFQFDLSEKGLYGSLKDSDKKLVNKAVYDRKTFLQEADLDTAFHEELRVPYLNAIAYGDFVTFSEDNSKYLKFDMKRFGNLDEDYQTIIAKEMADATFSSISEARKKFDDLLDKYEKASINNSGSSSFGGSGGSGGGNRGGNRVTDVYIGDKKDNNDNKTEEPAKEPYDDLTTVAWAKESILSLSEKGIVSGDGDRKFRPNDNIKREEFLKIALEAFGLVNNSAACELEDVASGAWYYKYVASGIEKDLVKGVDETHFGIGSEITRQDMATLAYRIAEYAGIDLSGGTAIEFLDDAEVADYAKDAVAAMSAKGIINGVGEGNFAPNNFATRAQACKIISQLLSLA